MHPRFSRLFVHPQSHKPLAFFGTVAGGTGIPQYVLAKEQGWPDEILQMLDRYQEERWINNNWANGFLFSLEEPSCHGVAVPQLSPEFGEEQTGLLFLLRTRGYYTYRTDTLRKDLDETAGMFRPREKMTPEDLERLEKEKKKKRVRTIKLP